MNLRFLAAKIKRLVAATRELQLAPPAPQVFLLVPCNGRGVRPATPTAPGSPRVIVFDDAKFKEARAAGATLLAAAEFAEVDLPIIGRTATDDGIPETD